MLGLAHVPKGVLSSQPEFCFPVGGPVSTREPWGCSQELLAEFGETVAQLMTGTQCFYYLTFNPFSSNPFSTSSQTILLVRC